MHVNPYGEDPVRLAVSFANDRPRTVTELRERCEEAGVSITARVTKDDLAQTLEMLDEWVDVVDAPDEQTRIALLNAMMAKYNSYPRMTNHAGDGWHIHFREDRCSLGRVLASVTSIGTALHLVGRGMHRLGRCDARGCDIVYADLSRTGVQRYCSTRCATRDAVSRHRARARAS